MSQYIRGMAKVAAQEEAKAFFDLLWVDTPMVVVLKEMGLWHESREVQDIDEHLKKQMDDNLREVFG